MKEYKAIGLLLLTSLIWGFAFVAQSQAGDYVSPYTYNGIRMILGFMTLLPALVGPLKKHKGDKNYYCKVLEGGLICGAILGAASTFQQFGIVATSAGKSGFITSLYVLFVPFLSVFLKKKVSVRTWICVFFGLCGAFFLSISGESGITYGDILVFICAVLFAVHIMFIDYYNFFIEGVVLSATQFLFAGLLNFIVGFIVRDVSFTGIEGAAVSIIYGGFFSCGLAFTFQVIGQKYVQPAKATLALCLESCWAAVGGALILGESMNTREIIGCIILFTSVLIAQLPEKKK